MAKKPTYEELGHRIKESEKAEFELKQAEAALRINEKRYRMSQALSHVGNWEYSLQTTRFWGSLEAKRIYGFDPEQLDFSTEEVENCIPERERVHQALVDLIEAGKPYNLEFEIHPKDSSEPKIISSVAELKQNEQGEPIVVGVIQDITERKRMEEELFRAQKLESMGILAGGIAHDFNNILTIIMGNISLAKMDLAQGDDPSELLTEAERASKRAQTLTKQLLTFAKGGAPVKEIASIKDIIKESSSFVLRGSKSGCGFSIREDLWPVDVDVEQMSQVINNIVINANQAMPKGGIIQVAAENLIIDNGQGLPVKAGKYVRISIKDQGVGIAKKYLLNIFDPYFTTKQEGSGLGLATTYSIIRKHDGHITVESKLGEGTTFHIYLPASDKAVPEKEEVRLIMPELTGKF